MCIISFKNRAIKVGGAGSVTKKIILDHKGGGGGPGGSKTDHEIFEQPLTFDRFKAELKKFLSGVPDPAHCPRKAKGG